MKKKKVIEELIDKIAKRTVPLSNIYTVPPSPKPVKEYREAVGRRYWINEP